MKVSESKASPAFARPCCSDLRENHCHTLCLAKSCSSLTNFALLCRLPASPPLILRVLWPMPPEENQPKRLNHQRSGTRLFSRTCNQFINSLPSSSVIALTSKATAIRKFTMISPISQWYLMHLDALMCLGCRPGVHHHLQGAPSCPSSANTGCSWVYSEGRTCRYWQRWKKQSKRLVIAKKIHVLVDLFFNVSCFMAKVNGESIQRLEP